MYSILDWDAAEMVGKFQSWNLSIMAALCVCCGGNLRAEGPTPCPRAHAHNDYLHERPLLDALDNGFCSVEADIYLVDDKLLVAHTRLELSAERTLRSLYLDPLRQRVNKNGGSVHGDGQPVTLLIDIKSDGETTYRALSKLLAQYRDIFTFVENGEVHDNAVIAIVSGNRAADVIAADSPRYVGIDGRLSDLESDKPAHLLPLISDHWGRNFRWRGEGEMPKTDREKLDRVIDQAHQKNRRVRFWATPDRPEIWGALRDVGADLINTDDLQGLSQFLRESK
jgi:hypothetical protein